MATIHEPARETPVHGEWDVVVAGGGLGGIAAALAAARAGASTLLVERNTFLGGVATAGMCCSIFNCYYTNRHELGPAGIPVEIADRLAEATGYGQAWRRHKGHVIYDIERAKAVFEDLLTQAGVTLLLGVPVAGAVTVDRQVRGLVVETKRGRLALLAKCVVDATGDADVAASAGSALVAPAKAPGHIHSLCFMLGNVDPDAFTGYFRTHPDQYPEQMDVEWTLAEARAQYAECGTFLFPHGGGMQMQAFQQARADGALPATVGRHDTTDACQMHLLRQNHTAHVITGFVRFDGLDPDASSLSLVDGRRMAFQVAEVYRRYIPGFQNAYVAGVAANLGVRFSRRIDGRSLFTKAMQAPGARVPDAVGRGVSYHHETRHPGPQAWGVQVMSAGTFEVPLSCLIPKDLDGLLAGAGRSASTEEFWLLRVMVTTMVVGQGAGVTAAVCARTGTVPRQVDVRQVQEALRAQGVSV
jgi:hypothetical protein